MANLRVQGFAAVKERLYAIATNSCYGKHEDLKAFAEELRHARPGGPKCVLGVECGGREWGLCVEFEAGIRASRCVIKHVRSSREQPKEFCHEPLECSDDSYFPQKG